MTELELLLTAQRAKIEAWFESKYQAASPLFYTSVDIRNAGFKSAVVDTNVFPAGFNNLSPQSYALCVEAIQRNLAMHSLSNNQILLIPESHTRNKFYFQNIAILSKLIKEAGYELRLGSLLDLNEPKPIMLDSGEELLLHPLMRMHNTLLLKNFKPALILLNHDLSEGLPPILEDLDQPIVPPLEMGWFNRSKTQHFMLYQKLANELAAFIDFDSWLIKPLFTSCHKLSFLDADFSVDSQSELLAKVSILFENIQNKYSEYGIKQTPFVVIKSDTGTYGMGIIMIQSPEELINLNRKKRLKMSVSKGKKPISDVIIQEGIPTIETFEDSVAEPVLYSIGQTIVGGFYRIHKNKTAFDNLNAPGMHFKAMADIPYVYSINSRLAQLAAGQEMNQGTTDHD